MIMTNAGINIKQSIEQSDIILVPFPFSDLSSSKKRPALVVSHTSFNRKSEDVVCCLITSNPDVKDGIKITKKDMESGFLEFDSTIKPYRIFSVSKSIIYRVLGRLNKEKARIASKEITKLIEV